MLDVASKLWDRFLSLKGTNLSVKSAIFDAFILLPLLFVSAYSLIVLIGGLAAAPFYGLGQDVFLGVFFASFQFFGPVIIIGTFNAILRIGVVYKVTRSLRRGYPNLHLINRCITQMYGELSVQGINLPYQDLELTKLNALPNQNFNDWIYQCSDAICKHLGLPSKIYEQIELVSSSIIEVPGRVQHTNDGRYLIEIHDRHMKSGNDILAILAHEIMHIYLRSRQIKRRDTFENEVLTDTATFLLGLGVLRINGVRREINEEVGDNHHYISANQLSLGYLTAEEFGLLLARRTIEEQSNYEGSCKTDGAKFSLSIGLGRAKKEYQCNPLLQYKDNVSWYTFSYVLKRRVLMSFKPWLPSSQNIMTADFGKKLYRFCMDRELALVILCPKCFHKLKVLSSLQMQMVTCFMCHNSYEACV